MIEAEVEAVAKAIHAIAWPEDGFPNEPLNAYDDAYAIARAAIAALDQVRGIDAASPEA